MGNDRDSINHLQVGFWLGTNPGTILYCPVNMTVNIYGITYAAPPVAATLAGTLQGELRSKSPVLGYTGTVDVFAIVSGNTIYKSHSDWPVAKLPAANLLVGYITNPGSTG